jgi:hypothetical protein
MTTAASRPFIAAMQVTLDGYSLGPDGTPIGWTPGGNGLARVPARQRAILRARP